LPKYAGQPWRRKEARSLARKVARLLPVCLVHVSKAKPTISMSCDAFAGTNARSHVRERFAEARRALAAKRASLNAQAIPHVDSDPRFTTPTVRPALQFPSVFSKTKVLRVTVTADRPTPPILLRLRQSTAPRLTIRQSRRKHAFHLPFVGWPVFRRSGRGADSTRLCPSGARPGVGLKFIRTARQRGPRGPPTNSSASRPESPAEKPSRHCKIEDCRLQI